MQMIFLKISETPLEEFTISVLDFNILKTNKQKNQNKKTGFLNDSEKKMFNQTSVAKQF